MSNISEDTASGKGSGGPVCRVAYTINNHQPVICTIISDQPMFYMDFTDEETEDDGMLFDAADLRILEQEMETLKKEISALDRFSTLEQNSQGDRECFSLDREWIENRSVTVSADSKPLLDMLGKSRMAAAYIDFAETNKVNIFYSRQVEDAFYDQKKGAILIHPRFGCADQVLLVARELRRHWQHRHGASIHPLLFHPDSAVLVNRAQAADLCVAMVRIAWELQLSGIREPWERVENSSMADLARAFACEAFLDFRTLNNGQASAAVLESWFLSERCRAEDKNLIKQMLADSQGYVFDEEQSGKALTPALISALGSLPYGKNYLAEHAATMIADPIFNEVRDRSNANFLWFIKFERSFRETERGLQSQFDTAITGVRRDVSRTVKNKDTLHAAGQTAEIVRLFPPASGEAPRPATRAGRRKNRKSAEIVTLRGAGD